MAIELQILPRCVACFDFIAYMGNQAPSTAVEETLQGLLGLIPFSLREATLISLRLVSNLDMQENWTKTVTCVKCLGGALVHLTTIDHCHVWMLLELPFGLVPASSVPFHHTFEKGDWH